MGSEYIPVVTVEMWRNNPEVRAAYRRAIDQALPPDIARQFYTSDIDKSEQKDPHCQPLSNS